MPEVSPELVQSVISQARHYVRFATVVQSLPVYVLAFYDWAATDPEFAVWVAELRTPRPRPETFGAFNANVQLDGLAACAQRFDRPIKLESLVELAETIAYVKGWKTKSEAMDEPEPIIDEPATPPE